MVRYQVRVYWLLCLCLVAAAGVAASSYALEVPPPKPAAVDPLTIGFAKETPPKGACDAIHMSDGDSTAEDSDQYEDDGWHRIMNHFADGFGPPGYPSDQAARSAMMAKDKDNLILCLRDASAYFAFGALELELVQDEDKRGSAARALAALDVALALSSDCAGKPPAVPPCCYDCNDCEGCSTEAGCPKKIVFITCAQLHAYRAGALAELGRADDAFKSLQAAIDGGFSAIRWITEGKHLTKLRAHPEWGARLDAMLSPRFPAIPKTPSVDLGYADGDGMRASSFQILCKDNRFLFTNQDPGGRSWSMGRWELKADGVWVTPEQRCDDAGREGPVTCTRMDAKEVSPRLAFSAAEARVLFKAMKGQGDKSPCDLITDAP
jgi:hypothetical protein